MRIIFSEFGEVYSDVYGNRANIKTRAQKWITHMMNSKYLFTIFFITTLLTLIIVLLATDSIPDAIAFPDDSTSQPQVGLINIDETQEKPAILVSSTATPATLTAPGIDGRLLQDKHCSQCHILQWIEQTHKSREEWESTLVQMEKMGVSLNAEEKVILLDFLADTNQP